jgi:protein ImuA
MTRISVGGRTTGKVVWCLTRLRSFFTPSPRSAFTQISLHLDRVNFVEGDKEETALAGFEEALGDAGLCAVVARAGAPADDGVTPPAACGGEVMDIGFGDPPPAAADGSNRHRMPTVTATRWPISFCHRMRSRSPVSVGDGWRN